ncbi:MAG: TIGR01440 family protein [Treponemataceae bacterium]|nr:TIGR01440 family protein [Treponemataceae bacterium]
MNEALQKIESETAAAIQELLEAHPLDEGSVLVIGCSSSEVGGGAIGSASSAEIGQAVFAGASRIARSRGIFLAAQCCEHLNRALVIEEACRRAFGYERVSVVPWLKGGGALATAAYSAFKNPAVVEHIRADAGIDIGGTLIGMHIREVAVPFRPKTARIGSAAVTAAWSRPKLIGGSRARYE